MHDVIADTSIDGIRLGTPPPERVSRATNVYWPASPLDGATGSAWWQGAVHVSILPQGRVTRLSYEIGSDCGSARIPGAKRGVLRHGGDPSELLKALAPCRKGAEGFVYRCGAKQRTVVEQAPICTAIKADGSCAATAADARAIRITIEDPPSP